MRAQRRWLVGAAIAAAVVLAAGGLIQLVHRLAGPLPHGSTWMESLLQGTSLLTVAAVILWHHPANRIGQLFLIAGWTGAVALLGNAYSLYVLLGPGGHLPMAHEAVWLASFAQFCFWYCLVALLYLFPDGRPASPMWRWVLAINAAGAVIHLLTVAFAPGQMEGQVIATANPYGIDGAEWLVDVRNAAIWSLPAGLLAGTVSLLHRYRRASGVTRMQIRWFAYAPVVGVTLIAVAGTTRIGSIAWGVGGSLVPIAAAVAILRYRLYDIDRLISRTVSYALLTGLLGAVYAGGVLLLGSLLRPLGAESDLAVAGSTLAVAALFGPARRRIQQAMDRRFNRARYDAQRTVEAFSDRLRDEVNLDQLRAELLAAVHQTVQARGASLWLRARETDR